MNHAFKLSAASLAMFLAACGGGGGGSSGGGTGLAALAVISAPTTAQAPAAPAAPATPAAPAAVAPASCSVTIYGDSIMYGASIDGGVGTDLLATMRPKYKVDNRSLSGDNARRRAPLFNNETVTTRFLVVELGFVDALQSFFDYESNLRMMVQRGKALGATVVITGVPQTILLVPNVDDFDGIAKKVAAEEGATVSNWRSLPVDGSSTTDGVHPTGKHAKELIGKLAETLDGLAPECK